MHQITKDRIRLIRAIEKTEKAGMRIITYAVRSNYGEHYLSYSQDDANKVSYAPSPEHKYNSDRRVKTTLNRYVRRRLNIDKETLSDKTLFDICANVFGQLANADGDITVVKGSAITDAYHQGFGGYSCMTGNASNYVELYALNPDKVSLLMYRNGIEARALMWLTDDGTTVIDRIYPNAGMHVDAIHTWAEKKGYVYRCDNHLPSGNIRLSDDKKHTVTLEHGHVFPYLDTFHYGEIYDDTVELCNWYTGYSVTFDRTDGSICEDGTVECYNCGNHVDEHEAYYQSDSWYCEDCFHEIFSYCECCEEYVLAEDIVHVQDTDKWACEYCVDNNYHQCDECSEYFENNILYASDTDKWYCEDCCPGIEECSDCGELVEEFEYAEDTENYYCKECSPLETCYECGDKFENTQTLEDDETYCTDCARDTETPDLFEQKVES